MGFYLASERMNECKGLIPPSILFIAVSFLPAPCFPCRNRGGWCD